MAPEPRTKTITGRRYDIALEELLLSQKNRSFASAIKELGINPCTDTRDLADYLMLAKVLDAAPLDGYGEVEYRTKDGKTRKINTNHGVADVVYGIQAGKWDPSEVLHEIVRHLRDTFRGLKGYSIDPEEANLLYNRARTLILNGYSVDVAVLI